jgi:hypothetical protein
VRGPARVCELYGEAHPPDVVRLKVQVAEPVPVHARPLGHVWNPAPTSALILSVLGCSVRFVTVRQLIPQDLADVPPGPELARVLAGIELPRLSGFDCVEVLKARYRQLNHDRARLMAAMAEVGVCGVVAAGDELRRMAAPDEFSADEIRAALVLTRRAADAQFGLAYDVVTRLPAVHAAMEAGVLVAPGGGPRGVCGIAAPGAGFDHGAAGRADQKVGYCAGSGVGPAPL